MQSMDNLKRLKSLSKASNESWEKYQAFEKSIMTEGAIPLKYKELIALSVSLATQCSYCLEYHRLAALNSGATQDEIAETILISAALRAGASIAYGSQILPDDGAEESSN